jgi:hypothetical protein
MDIGNFMRRASPPCRSTLRGHANVKWRTSVVVRDDRTRPVNTTRLGPLGIPRDLRYSRHITPTRVPGAPTPRPCPACVRAVPLRVSAPDSLGVEALSTIPTERYAMPLHFVHFRIGSCRTGCIHYEAHRAFRVGRIRGPKLHILRACGNILLSSPGSLIYARKCIENDKNSERGV